MFDISQIAQAMPAAASDWGLEHEAGTDESGRNLRGFLVGFSAFASAVYAPVANLGMSSFLMLLGLAACSLPLCSEMRRQGRGKN